MGPYTGTRPGINELTMLAGSDGVEAVASLTPPTIAPKDTPKAKEPAAIAREIACTVNSLLIAVDEMQRKVKIRPSKSMVIPGESGRNR